MVEGRKPWSVRISSSKMNLDLKTSRDDINEGGQKRERDVKVARDHQNIHLAIELSGAFLQIIRLPIDQNPNKTKASSVRNLDDEETEVVRTMRKQ